MVEYEFGTDMKAKEAELQQAISGVQQMLPATAMAPEVAALNFNSMPVVQLAVSSTLPPQQLAGLLGTSVVPKLQAIDGVQAVTLSGVQQMQLNIQLKPAKVAALGVTPTQIMTAITQANVTTGAGSVTSGSLVYPITVSATARDREGARAAGAAVVERRRGRLRRRGGCAGGLCLHRRRHGSRGEPEPPPRRHRRSRSATSPRSRSLPPRSPRSRGPTERRPSASP